MIVADPGRFTFPACTCTLVGRRQVGITSQLSGGTVGKVQVAERRLGVEVDGRYGVLQQRTGGAQRSGSRQRSSNHWMGHWARATRTGAQNRMGLYEAMSGAKEFWIDGHSWRSLAPPCLGGCHLVWWGFTIIFWIWKWNKGKWVSDKETAGSIIRKLHIWNWIPRDETLEVNPQFNLQDRSAWPTLR